MLSWLRSVALSAIFLMAYTTLMSGGELPSSSGQFGIVACQSILLTILTNYLSWTSMRLCARRYEDGDRSLSPPDDEGWQLHDGIQKLPCAILLISASTRQLLFANQSALQLFALGWMPQSQLAQRRVDELFHFVDAVSDEPEIRENPILQSLQKRERVAAQDIHICLPNGDKKRISVTAVPLFDAHDQCISVMALVQDLTEHHLQLQRMEEVAYLDPLTRLPNRLSILRRVQEAFDRSDSSRFALLYMDFDRFKLINDSLGHEVGDQLLVEIGQRIQRSVRATKDVCVPARLGGDEFVVLLDRIADTALAIEVAERLLQTLSEPYHLAGHSIVSTASIGIVTSDQHVASATDMLRSADLAMYKSKTAGKARYSVFDESLKREVEQRLQLENELRAAIKYNEFDFDIQSVIELNSRAIVGGEALLRWQHPRLGRIAASQFVDVATETGLIVPMGDQLLKQACLFAGSMDAIHPSWRLHINISRLQLLLPKLLELLDRTLDESGLNPERLVLEIAEASVKDEPEKAIERIHELKQRNVRICLDNFGSGASPLAFLKDLPIDFLKLDRSLAHAIESSPETCVLIEALVTIATTYRVEVIAEGVENELQLKKLSELGCRFGQGYVFQRPVPAEVYPKREPLNFRSGCTRQFSPQE
jgi:diguanylate cyclase (GGDEF)-like protein